MPAARNGPLSSSPIPPSVADDHVRGEGPLVIEYADFACPFCAQTDALLRDLSIRRMVRHFPLDSQRPRARALAHAAEAAALQGRFWDFHDALYCDHGRLEDPHLWERCRRLGIDLDRFERDRRSAAVAERVERDFRTGIRGGVTATPTLVIDGVMHPGVPGPALLTQLAR